MPINWKTVTAISAGTVVVGSALIVNALHRDLYNRFPTIDHKITRKAFRRTMLNAMTGKYEADLSDPEIQMLFLDQVAELKQST